MNAMNEPLATPSPAVVEAAGAPPVAAPATADERAASEATGAVTPAELAAAVAAATPAPTAPPDDSVTASDITGDAPAARPDYTPALDTPAQPAQPTIDTSDYDTASSYEPSFKDGIHIVKGVVSEFGPSTKRDTEEYLGWRLTFNLIEEYPDDSGGMLPVGHRIGPMTIFTQPNQYADEARRKRETLSILMGLNGIVKDKRIDPKYTKADQAFRALESHKKLPLRYDTDTAHYEQWKGTNAKFVIKKAGENTNLLDVIALDTPADAPRR